MSFFQNVTMMNESTDNQPVREEYITDKKNIYNNQQPSCWNKFNSKILCITF